MSGAHRGLIEPARKKFSTCEERQDKIDETVIEVGAHSYDDIRNDFLRLNKSNEPKRVRSGHEGRFCDFIQEVP